MSVHCVCLCVAPVCARACVCLCACVCARACVCGRTRARVCVCTRVCVWCLLRGRRAKRRPENIHTCKRTRKHPTHTGTLIAPEWVLTSAHCFERCVSPTIQGVTGAVVCPDGVEKEMIPLSPKDKTSQYLLHSRGTYALVGGTDTRQESQFERREFAEILIHPKYVIMAGDANISTQESSPDTEKQKQHNRHKKKHHKHSVASADSSSERASPLSSWETQQNQLPSTVTAEISHERRGGKHAARAAFPSPSSNIGESQQQDSPSMGEISRERGGKRTAATAHNHHHHKGTHKKGVRFNRAYDIALVRLSSPVHHHAPIPLACDGLADYTAFVPPPR